MRFNFFSASSACARAFSRSPAAASRLARPCSACAANMRASSFAITCPRFTRWPKSAYSSAIRPDTWLPTCTVTSAVSVPVAVTRPVTSPRSTRAFSSL